MTITTLRVTANTRDQLTRVAKNDFGGLSAEAAVQRLLDEHVQLRCIMTMDAYRTNDPEGWDDYLTQAEADSLSDVSITD